MIKTGGANVSPREIDAVLAETDGVLFSQTVGVPHDTLGEMIVSCVVPSHAGQLDEAVLRDCLKARLASYKVPRRIVFVERQDLSLTGSAKVRAAATRELAMKRLSLSTGTGQARRNQ
jgi:fatty-acyl-CoA synthase